MPLREIELSPRAGQTADGPVRVYDTSGAHGDAQAAVDLTAGLPKLRDAWIRERGDVEEYPGRPVRPDDDGRRASATADLPGRRVAPLRAGAGRNVTQMQ